MKSNVGGSRKDTETVMLEFQGGGCAKRSDVGVDELHCKRLHTKTNEVF